MDREQVIDTLRTRLASHAEGLVAAYLFGSVARGSATGTSDVDVGVILAGGRPRTIEEYPFALKVELERGLRVPVDVVVMNGAPPDLLMRILRDGILLLELDRAARIEFEVQARNAYFDLAPFLKRYRQKVLGSL